MSQLYPIYPEFQSLDIEERAFRYECLLRWAFSANQIIPRGTSRRFGLNELESLKARDRAKTFIQIVKYRESRRAIKKALGEKIKFQ